MRRASWKSRGLIVIGLVLGLALPTQAAIVSGDSRLGGLAFYDSDLDITWSANANINNGAMTWSAANAWATTLTLGGVSGWRLPTTLAPDASCLQVGTPSGDFGCQGSEMGHLFNVEGITAAVPGVFSNVQSSIYWSGTVYAPHPINAWVFDFDSGSQRAGDDDIRSFAWAVRSGDVAAVPAPSAMLLMGSGLVGLLAWRRFGRG